MDKNGLLIHCAFPQFSTPSEFRKNRKNSKFFFHFQTHQLETIIRKIILCESNDKIQPLKLTSKSQSEVYWLFNEIQAVLTFQKTASEFFRLILKGKEAVWRSEDPWPFLVLHYVQIPFLLLKAIFTGQEWNKVNFCLGQVL